MSSAPQKGQLRIVPIGDALSYYQSYVAGAKQLPMQLGPGSTVASMGPGSMKYAGNQNGQVPYPTLVGIPAGGALGYHMDGNKFVPPMNQVKAQAFAGANWKAAGQKPGQVPSNISSQKHMYPKPNGMGTVNPVICSSSIPVTPGNTTLLSSMPQTQGTASNASSVQETSRVHILRNQTFISTRKRCNQCITCLQAACQTCTNCVNKKKRKRSCENSVPCLGEIIKFTERVFDKTDFQVLANSLSPKQGQTQNKPASFDIVYKRQEELKILKKSIVAEEKALEYLLKALNST